MKTNLKLFLAYLLEVSYSLLEEDTDKFKAFIAEEDLEVAYMKAVSDKYIDDTKYNDILECDALCAMDTDLVSCFINWSESTDVDWSAVNVKWQDYIKSGITTTCQI
jgi:hypothetical protein